MVEPEGFSWRVHPARERTGAAVATSLVIVTLGIVVYLSTESVLLGCLAAAVMTFALNRFYFPSRFVIDDEGITARYLFRTQRYRWVDVRRFLKDDRGGYLSTREAPSRLDAYRGMNILFGTKGERVVGLIKSQLRESS